MNGLFDDPRRTFLGQIRKGQLKGTYLKGRGPRQPATGRKGPAGDGPRREGRRRAATGREGAARRRMICGQPLDSLTSDNARSYPTHLLLRGHSPIVL